MVAKPDFSRLVMLDLTPTEAATLAVWLDSKLFFMDERQEADMRSIVTGMLARINLQLDQLHWPRERRQAPYPV